MKIIKREANDKNHTLYGHKMSVSRLLGAESSSEQIDKFRQRKILSIELLRMKTPYPVDVIETTYTKNGILEREYKELEAVRSDEELEAAQRIFKQLERVLNKRDVRRINARAFVKEITDKLSRDPRFAYKQIDGKIDKNTPCSVYIYTALSLIVASASIADDLDFETPLGVMFSSERGALTLSFITCINSGKAPRSRTQIFKNPRLEAKLAFLSSLCLEDNVEGRIKIADGVATLEYKIKEAPPDAPCLYSAPDEEDRILNELLNAFNPPSSDIREPDGQGL